MSDKIEKPKKYTNLEIRNATSLDSACLMHGTNVLIDMFMNWHKSVLLREIDKAIVKAQNEKEWGDREMNLYKIGSKRYCLQRYFVVTSSYAEAEKIWENKYKSRPDTIDLISSFVQVEGVIKK